MEEVRADDYKNPIVVQSNVLIRSAYTMTLLEKRLLMLAMSKINTSVIPKKNELIEVAVHRDEWSKIYKESNPWRDLNLAADRLLGRVLIINPTKEKAYKKKLNWTDSCEYYENKVIIKFGYSISSLIAGLYAEFTQADLLDVAKLDSFYAVRLYELIKQYQSTGFLFITVEEFRIITKTEDKYSQFFQLNQRVIKPVVESINKKIPSLKLNVEYVKQKYSRSVTSLKFSFKKTNQPDLNQDTSGKNSNYVDKQVILPEETPRQKRARITESVMNIEDTDW